ncbi:hypothetical protein JavanS201_0014 [Streptococcus satellite phage Javan201]|uniref:hypothetical protein n=1 Tax=Streptococcus equinus TaxID=1335 RepID=UPI00089143F2|nr:hypothetical protein [Streptococcus equinus]QBX07925.1 hypothetical protein JavanS201_0014 [Streptococcus satellite phage Javan201]QBX07941.1 hypothetical protein JavanS203_0014 [Streptococcus satellite phage Javan203]SDQ06751.1 hypothetical protein SAMN04488495_0119 [Streptococcus equinus]SEN49521.1 hypothetical protein SAMN04488496_0120 [Streptococcus equinus]
MKTSVGLLLDALSEIVPNWDIEDRLYSSVVKMIKELPKEDSYRVISQEDLKLFTENDSLRILQYIEDNQNNLQKDSFEIELMF